MPLTRLLVTGLAVSILSGAICVSSPAGPGDPVDEADDPGSNPALAPPTLSEAALRSPEPVCARSSTVICEDFESPGQSEWSEHRDNDFNVQTDAAFASQKSLRQRYRLAQVSAGWLTWFMGDHPLGGVRSDERFDEIYLRFYHRFQEDWPEAFPPKMARVRSHFVDGGWRFAWSEYTWIQQSQPGGTVVSDPVSHVAEPDGTQYLEREDRRWLGRKLTSLRFADRLGEFVAIEVRVKLNTPGQNDGLIEYWIDGRPDLRREGINLRGAYTGTTINTIMLDTYWNDGAPEEGLMRWYDNVVVATERIGCARFTVAKSPLADQRGWRLQLASAPNESALVWDSGEVSGAGTEIDISESTGDFATGVAPCLYPSASYVMRARHADGSGWSRWSDWTPVFGG